MFSRNKQTHEPSEALKAIKALTKAIKTLADEQKKTNDNVSNVGYLLEKFINEQNQIDSILVNDSPAILSTTEKKIVKETNKAKTKGFDRYVMYAIQSKAGSRDYALMIGDYMFKESFSHEGIKVSTKGDKTNAFITKSKNMRPAQIRKISKSVAKQIEQEEGIKITVGGVKE